MIVGLKAEIKLIDDKKYLVTVKGNNWDSDKQGNSGAVCEDFESALELAKEKLEESAKALQEQSDTLPGMDDEAEEGS